MVTTPAAPVAASTGTDWISIAQGVSTVVTALAPFVEAAVPGASLAVSIGQKIIQGVVASEPTAVSLYNQITSGTPATPAQLQQYSSDYEAAYQKLNADILAKLAATPA